MEPLQGPTTHTATGDQDMESFSFDVNLTLDQVAKNLGSKEVMDMLRETVRIGDWPPWIVKAAHRVGRTVGGSAGAKEAWDNLAIVSESTLSEFKTEVHIHTANAIAAGANPVDVYFCLLPTPEKHEHRHVSHDTTPLHESYTLAFKVFTRFKYMQSQEWMEARCKNDPVLNLLCHYTNQLDLICSTGHDWQVRAHSGFGMYSSLLRLAWYAGIPQGKALLGQYSTRTRRVLEYFGWVILGRKDITCMVPKPLEGILRRTWRNTRNEDLGRLPAMQMESDWETNELGRLARLFQVAFNQCLLSANTDRDFFALSSDGITELKLNQAGVCCMRLEYLGTSPSIDLTRPVAQAALHNCACCIIETSARPLLELFFRKSCTEILFADFVLRNAKTTVIMEEATHLSNMEPLHTVAVLRTPSGRGFVLDPSAAQYGWKETFAPEEEYIQSRLDHHDGADKQYPPGALDAAKEPTRFTPRPEVPGPELENWVSKCIAEDIVSLVEAHSMVDGGFGSVLRLPTPQFDEHCLKLEQTLRTEMRTRDKQRIFEIRTGIQPSGPGDELGSASQQ